MLRAIFIMIMLDKSLMAVLSLFHADQRSIFHADRDQVMVKYRDRNSQTDHVADCQVMLERPQGNLSQIMRHINSEYAAYFNVRYKRVGPLFQGRYKSLLVERDAYASERSIYI